MSTEGTTQLLKRLLAFAGLFVVLSLSPFAISLLYNTAGEGSSDETMGERRVMPGRSVQANGAHPEDALPGSFFSNSNVDRLTNRLSSLKAPAQLSSLEQYSVTINVGVVESRLELGYEDLKPILGPLADRLSGREIPNAIYLQARAIRELELNADALLLDTFATRLGVSVSDNEFTPTWRRGNGGRSVLYVSYDDPSQSGAMVERRFFVKGGPELESPLVSSFLAKCKRELVAKKVGQQFPEILAPSLMESPEVLRYRESGSLEDFHIVLRKVSELTIHVPKLQADMLLSRILRAAEQDINIVSK